MHMKSCNHSMAKVRLGRQATTTTRHWLSDDNNSSSNDNNSSSDGNNLSFSDFNDLKEKWDIFRTSCKRVDNFYVIKV